MQRYHVSSSADQLCGLLGLSKESVLAQAGLPADLGDETKGVTAREYFAFWSAANRAAGREDISLFLGQMTSAAPHNSETAAFALSPDVRTGLQRLAIFKP